MDEPTQVVARPRDPRPGPPADRARISPRRLGLAAALVGACVAGVAGLGPAGAVGLVVVAGATVLGLGRPLWVVVLVLVAVPFGLDRGLSVDLGSLLPVGAIDGIQLVALLAVLVVVLHRLAAGRTPLRWHPAASWAVLLAAWALVAAATARDVPEAVAPTIALGVAVALTLAVYSACQRPSDARDLVVVLAAVGGAVCLYSLGAAADLEVAGVTTGTVANRVSGIFQSPNQLGTFSGILLFVGLGLALGSRRRVDRWVGSACALSAFAALLVTLSRGSWIGAMLALLVFLALSSAGRRLLPRLLAPAVVVVLLGLLFAPGLSTVVRDRAADLFSPGANPDDARPLIYREAVRQIVDRPLTGQGPGNYAVVARSSEATAPSVDALHSHNVLLQVAAETGLPAAAALVALTLVVARVVLRALSRLPGPDRELLAGLSCALVAVVGQGLVDFTFGNPTLLFLTWTVLGLVLATAAGGSRPAPLDAPAGLRRTTGTAGAGRLRLVDADPQPPEATSSA